MSPVLSALCHIRTLQPLYDSISPVDWVQRKRDFGNGRGFDFVGIPSGYASAVSSSLRVRAARAHCVSVADTAPPRAGVVGDDCRMGDIAPIPSRALTVAHKRSMG